MLAAALFLAIQIAFSVAAALSAGTSSIRKILLSLFLLAALVFPLQARDPLAKVGLTLIALMALIKCVFIINARPEWQTPSRRIWQVLVPFDIRRTRGVPPGLEWKSLVRIAAATFVVAVVIWLALTQLTALSGGSLWLAKWVCMLFAAYSVMEWSGELLRSVHRLVGVAIEPLQRDPIASRSVAEFWGERWNLPMTRWLNEFFFRPLARRGHPLVGIVAAFVVSAALHAWLFFAATG
ncbi:MAG TPA: MBOAT family protein [Terriglobales bacterium]|nr:MBOAT family protein [Terriglobales bacterium]